MYGIDNSIPVAARSNCVGLRPLASWYCGFESFGGLDICLLSVVWRQVEVSATARSLVQRILTECGVSGCDHEALKIKRFRRL
jgi:hypothetical protein